MLRLRPAKPKDLASQERLLLLMQEHGTNLTQKEYSKLWGFSQESTTKYLKRFGFVKPPFRFMPPPGLLRQVLDELYVQGLSDGEITKKLGRSRGALRNWRTGRTGVNLFDFECLAEMVGFRVVLEKKEPKT